jgi:RNA polymerase sigma factor (sigma-70 family)
VGGATPTDRETAPFPRRRQLADTPAPKATFRKSPFSGAIPSRFARAARALEVALARIRPEYREAVVLCYREELSIEEVAEIMSLPSGTVKTYLFRARKELAQILSAQGWSKISASSA